MISKTLTDSEVKSLAEKVLSKYDENIVCDIDFEHVVYNECSTIKKDGTIYVPYGLYGFILIYDRETIETQISNYINQVSVLDNDENFSNNEMFDCKLVGLCVKGTLSALNEVAKDDGLKVVNLIFNNIVKCGLKMVEVTEGRFKGIYYIYIDDNYHY